MMKCSIVLLCALWVNTAVAQKKKWQERGYFYPKAVLVQLRSEKGKIAYMEKQGRYKDAEQVKKDAIGVNTAMINDFKDHFKLCPFYFYVDTNAGLIKEKNFEGILLDSDMKPVSGVMKDKGNQYYIVHYGSPAREKLNDNEDAARTRLGQGLVIDGPDYVQLEKPFTFYYYNNKGYYGLGRKNPRYNYSSDKFKIEYYELASDMNAGMREFFDR